jgi:hypothetical protein
LAYSLARDPDEGARLLRVGMIDRWLRRNLGDPALAVRVDEVVRVRLADGAAEDRRADALMTMRVIALLDPLAPLCWQGLALWPDGLGPALAFANHPGAPAGLTEVLVDLVGVEAAASWATMRPERCDIALLRAEARKRGMVLRLSGWSGGLPRLRYALNPLMPCRSGKVGGALVANLPALLPALEAAAAKPGARQTLPLDREAVAFVAARDEQRLGPELVGMSDATPPAEALMLQLRVLATLQHLGDSGPLPGVANWLAEHAAPALEGLRNRARREATQQSLATLGQAGDLRAVFGMVANPALAALDTHEGQIADAAVRRIDAELAQIAAGSETRASAARRVGEEIALGVGMMALTVALVALVAS